MSDADDRLPGSGENGRLRLGVIGAGAWAVAAHIPGFLARPEVEPYIVSRRDPVLLEEIRARFGFARGTPDWREVIEARPDIVALTGPGHLRGEQALAAIDAGIHVLAEKPFTIDPADAWAIDRRARERRVHVVLCYTWNEMGISEQASRLIAGADGIGRVEFVSIEMSTVVRDLLLRGRTYLADGTPAPLPRHETWSDPSMSGGGYGQAQLTHAIGLMLRLVPDLRARDVAAFTASHEAAVELHDAIVVRFTDGTLASIGGASLPHDTFGGTHQLRIRVTGSRGQVMLDMTANRVVRAMGPDLVEPALSADDVRWSFQLVTDRLVDLVLGRTTDNPSPASLGAKVVEILDGMYRSAATGSIVQVAG